MSRHYPDRPVAAVGAVVLRGDHVLLIRRGTPPRRGEWSLPGGAQDLGETVAETAVREVREETGVAIEVAAVIDVVDSISRDESGAIAYHYTLIDVAARWRSGEPVAADDADDAAWHRLDALDPLNLWQETRRIIKAGARMLGAGEP